MTARDRHLQSQLTLDILLRQVLRKVGGTGCPDYTPEQYIAQVLKEWSNTKDRLMLAIGCFTEIRDYVVGCATSDARRNTLLVDMDKGKHDAAVATDADKEQRLGSVGETQASKDADRDGWIVCGVGRDIQNKPR